MELGKKKILVADDDAGIQDVLQLLLEDAGYDVILANDGAVIRNIQRGNCPDLFLLDIWMSGWDGRDICKYLKSQEATRHIPIILISANKDTEKIAREAGADDFIAKPFDMDEMLQKIARYL